MNSLPPFTIIDTAGQWTPVINRQFNTTRRAQIGRQLLSQFSQAGQVAFIYPVINSYLVQMMGDELSVNGAIAGCYYLLNKLKANQVSFYTSGINTPINGSLKNSLVSVQFPASIIISATPDQVILTGIKYQFLNSTKPTLEKARQYCGQDPAAGFILSPTPGSIIPIVYVKATDTLTHETACGSASLAYFLKTKKGTIIQPSGKTITVKPTPNGYQITTSSKIIVKRLLK